MPDQEGLHFGGKKFKPQNRKTGEPQNVKPGEEALENEKIPECKPLLILHFAVLRFCGLNFFSRNATPANSLDLIRQTPFIWRPQTRLLLKNNQFNFTFKNFSNMLKALKLFLIPIVAIVAVMVACNKSSDQTTEELVDQALYSAQERGGMGRFGCYELVFPVTIVLPDGSTAEVNSYDEVKQALRAYFEANGPRPHHGNRPHLSFEFPISVVTEDGEIITLDSEEQLRRLRADCAGATFGNHGPQGHGQHGLSCFDIVFPITIAFPDGTTAEAADRQALHLLIRTWRKNNPGATERPKIVFPLTVKMDDDGTLVTVNSPEELRQLKQDCE